MPSSKPPLLQSACVARALVALSSFLLTDRMELLAATTTVRAEGTPVVAIRADRNSGVMRF